MRFTGALPPTGALLPVLLLVALAPPGCADPDAPVTELDILEIADVGFDGPAAVVVDTIDQVYFVSNVGGRFGARDGNGFLSRISPDGEVLELQWGAAALFDPELALHSPKGMAIKGDSLLVADLDCIRIIHRTTGEPLARECVRTAEILSDVDLGPDGSVYMVDSGLRVRDDGELEPGGTDAVYRVVLEDRARSTTLARADDLGNPSAVAVGTRGIFVSTSTTGEIFRVVPGEAPSTVYPRTGRHLDGIAFLPDGGFAFSSWSDSTVFRVRGEDGTLERLLQNIPSPGGIAYDPQRSRLIVPLRTENRVIFVELP